MVEAAVVDVAADKIKAMSGAEVRSGGCLCGGVKFRLLGPMRDVINCFCEQCRKTSGHHVAASRISHEGFELLSDETLRWYQSSESAKRGFCNVCGSSLFWQPTGEDSMSVMAGAIDKPTGLRTKENMLPEDKSDYHALPELTANT